jgi:hypothetical protein
MARQQAVLDSTGYTLSGFPASPSTPFGPRRQRIAAGSLVDFPGIIRINPHSFRRLSSTEPHYP